MSYLVVCTFDLAASTRNNYQTAYAVLEEIGLYQTLTASHGNEIALPTTTAAGEFEGSSVVEVRDYVASMVREAFYAEGLNSEIFVSVGGNWAWTHCTT